MTIFIGDVQDSYVEKLAREYQTLLDDDIELYRFRVDEFRGGEYKLRILENGEDLTRPGQPDYHPSNENPDSLKGKIMDSDVFLVIRGGYGDDWDSDKIFNLALQGSELLKGGNSEFLDGEKAKNLYLVMPHEPFTKQDHMFTDSHNDDKPIRGEAVTLRMNRKTLQASGYDRLFTIYPHDFRREGDIRHRALKTDLTRPLTDWRKYDNTDLTTLDDWTNYAWAIDAVEPFVKHIKRYVPGLDVATSPDTSGNSFSTLIRRALDIWETDGITKHRSRAEPSKLHVVKGFDPEHIKGKVVGIFDDWILSGGTLINGIRSADECGASEIHVFIVHAELATWNEGKEKKSALEEIKNIELKNASEIHLHVMDTVRLDGAIETFQGENRSLTIIPSCETVALSMYYAINRPRQKTVAESLMGGLDIQLDETEPIKLTELSSTSSEESPQTTLGI